jgi:hypothetical protein
MPSEVAPQSDDRSRGATSAEEGLRRRFEISDVSTAVLHVLQGACCLGCQSQGGDLRPAGRACTVSPNGTTLWWDVRAHDKCLNAAGGAS